MPWFTTPLRQGFFQVEPRVSELNGEPPSRLQHCSRMGVSTVAEVVAAHDHMTHTLGELICGCSRAIPSCTLEYVDPHNSLDNLLLPENDGVNSLSMGSRVQVCGCVPTTGTCRSWPCTQPTWRIATVGQNPLRANWDWWFIFICQPVLGFHPSQPVQDFVTHSTFFQEFRDLCV